MNPMTEYAHVTHDKPTASLCPRCKTPLRRITTALDDHDLQLYCPKMDCPYYQNLTVPKRIQRDYYAPET